MVTHSNSPTIEVGRGLTRPAGVCRWAANAGTGDWRGNAERMLFGRSPADASLATSSLDSATLDEPNVGSRGFRAGSRG
jgi:hypothetical protein